MPRVRSAELPLTRMVQVFRTLPLGNAYNEEGQRQQNGQAGQAHQAVAHRIADGQQQDAGLHAHFSHQRTGQQARQQVADAQQAEQSAGHAVGKAVFLLQQADHHTAGNGADAAEKKVTKPAFRRRVFRCSIGFSLQYSGAQCP